MMLLVLLSLDDVLYGRFFSNSLPPVRNGRCCVASIGISESTAPRDRVSEGERLDSSRQQTWYLVVEGKSRTAAVKLAPLIDEERLDLHRRRSKQHIENPCLKILRTRRSFDLID